MGQRFHVVKRFVLSPPSRAILGIMVETPVFEWERLLAAERHLQALVKGSVLVGGSAAAGLADLLLGSHEEGE